MAVEKRKSSSQCRELFVNLTCQTFPGALSTTFLTQRSTILLVNLFPMIGCWNSLSWEEMTRGMSAISSGWRGVGPRAMSVG